MLTKKGLETAKKEYSKFKRTLTVIY